jgi:hypothetical protein
MMLYAFCFWALALPVLLQDRQMLYEMGSSNDERANRCACIRHRLIPIRDEESVEKLESALPPGVVLNPTVSDSAAFWGGDGLMNSVEGPWVRLEDFRSQFRTRNNGKEPVRFFQISESELVKFGLGPNEGWDDNKYAVTIKGGPTLFCEVSVSRSICAGSFVLDVPDGI